MTKDSTGRSKVLISAYACEPGSGSEYQVGWSLVRNMANYHQVWVLTRLNNRPGIEQQLAREPVPDLHFVYFDLPLWGRFRGLVPGIQVALQIYYYLWQLCAYFIARRLRKNLGFDLVHHVTFAKHWGPSFLALLPVPFVWGPVGGGDSTPVAFRGTFDSRAKLYENLRDLAIKVGERDPFVSLTARRSVSALATTDNTATRLRELGAKNTRVFPQLTLSEEEIEQLSGYSMRDELPMRFVSIGRLLHWKGFHLGLRAFAEAHLVDAEYWIVGDGREREALEALARELGIEPQVRFWGALPREETWNKLGECHVLVHPSMHDSFPGVCLEAMAAGRPVICLDLAGPAVQVTPETGIKVPAYNPEQSVKDIAEAMKNMASDWGLCHRLGQRGQERVQSTFTWATVGERLSEEIYFEALERSKK